MKLQKWREARGLGRTEAARIFGVNHSTIGRWEDGTRVPRPEQMKLIARITRGDVGFADFYEDNPPRGRTKARRGDGRVAA